MDACGGAVQAADQTLVVAMRAAVERRRPAPTTAEPPKPWEADDKSTQRHHRTGDRVGCKAGSCRVLEKTGGRWSRDTGSQRTGSVREHGECHPCLPTETFVGCGRNSNS